MKVLPFHLSALCSGNFMCPLQDVCVLDPKVAFQHQFIVFFGLDLALSHSLGLCVVITLNRHGLVLAEDKVGQGALTQRGFSGTTFLNQLSHKLVKVNIM